ncbi:MAG: ACT domain-containing protein [Bacillota bacterium]|nr:ACT domain-containing protein [Bacillota bacterium]
MELKRINQDLTVCKVKELAPEALQGEFCFVGKTDEELSLVCLTEHVPEDTIEREDGWLAFRIQGILDFSLVGILAPIASLLAENRIGIFAVSTFNTDYILVKKESFEQAMKVLSEAGYAIV